MSQELFFKEITGRESTRDIVWIHPTGQQSIIIKGLDNLSAILIRERLDDRKGANIFQPGVLIQELHQLMNKEKCRAFIGIISKTKNDYQLDLVGEIKIIQLFEHKPATLFLPEESCQSNCFLGQSSPPRPICRKLSPESDTGFIAISNGLDHLRLIGSDITLAQLRQMPLNPLLEKYSRAKDWSAIFFPFKDISLMQSIEKKFNPTTKLILRGQVLVSSFFDVTNTPYGFLFEFQRPDRALPECHTFSLATIR